MEGRFGVWFTRLSGVNSVNLPSSAYLYYIPQQLYGDGHEISTKDTHAKMQGWFICVFAHMPMTLCLLLPPMIDYYPGLHEKSLHACYIHKHALNFYNHAQMGGKHCNTEPECIPDIRQGVFDRR